MDDRDRSNPKRRRVSSRDYYSQDSSRSRSSAGSSGSQSSRRSTSGDSGSQRSSRDGYQRSSLSSDPSASRDGYPRSTRSSQQPSSRDSRDRITYRPAGSSTSRDSYSRGTRSSDSSATRDGYSRSSRSSAGSGMQDSRRSTVGESGYQRSSRQYQARSSRDDYRIASSRAAQTSSDQAERRTRQTQSQYDRSSRQYQSDRATRQTATRRSVSSARADTQRVQVRVERPRTSSRMHSTWPSEKRSKAPIIIGAIAAVVVIAIIGVFVYMNNISGNLHSGITQDLRSALVETDMAKEPFYMLLMGVDGSAERDEDEEFGGGEYRSDSIMLARIDAPNKTVTLVSIHRDTRVDLGEYGYQKINAAHFFGGPALAVETVSKLAGVDISHYAEINLDGLSAIIDSLGGIEVDVPIAIDDYEAGDVALEPGLQTLNGEQALVLCRSRNAYMNTTGDADSMRSANQRLVLSAMAKKLLSSDIATIARTVSDVSAYVTTDLELNDIIGLAQAMQGLDSETGIYTANEPADAVYEDDIWWCVTDEEAWKTMMDRVKQGLPPTEYTQIDETTGTVLANAGGEVEQDDKYAWVTVINGTTRSGLATEAVETLDEAGYVHVAIGSVEDEYYQETLVVYDDPAQKYGADTIVDVLGQGRVVLNDGSYSFDGTFCVLIGSDWK